MDIKDRPSLGKMLIALREANGFTQEFVASQLNITRPAYAYYELGKTEPSISSLLILSKIFNVPVETFLISDEQVLTLSDSNAPKQMEFPTSMGSLTKEEREFVVQLRLASPSLKRKISNQFIKEAKLKEEREKNKI